jgi:hypothetical protein
MKISLLILSSFLLSIAAASAAEVKLIDCAEAGASLETIIPGAENQRSFYNGRVTLFRYDIMEPAAGAQGIAIVYDAPEASEYLVRKCMAVPYLYSVGLMKDVKASYNAKTGVTAIVPIMRDNFGEGRATSSQIELSIRQVNTGKMGEGFVIKATTK